MIKRIFSLALVMATAAAFIPYVVAGELEDAKPEVSFYAMQRMRYESMNNYFDANDNINDRLDFWTSRTLVGMKTMLARDVWSKVELQHVGSFGNQTPQRSDVYSFAGPVFQNWDRNQTFNGAKQNEVELYRAEVGMDKIGGSNFSVALGRQEYTVGNNLIFGNEPFYNGTVFDGLTGSYQFKSWKLTGIYFVTQERQDVASSNPAFGNFNPVPGNEDQKVGGFDGYLTLNDGENDNWGDIQPYIYYFKDGNRDFSLHLEETVYGAWWGRHAKTVEKVKANPMNWGIEIAVEDGSELKNPGTNATDSFTGWIAEGNFGWNFLSHDRIIHRPEVGFIMTPGDDNLTNSDGIGWSEKFGDIHCRFGCADFFEASPSNFFAGITATWVGYTIMTNPGRHMGYVKYWDFKPTEDMIKTSTTGPKTHVYDYGTELDLGYSYGYTANVKLFATVAQFMPDRGVTGSASAPQDTIERIYGGLWLKFH
ncbi:MAG TPA: hypothetical protein VNI57_06760 [Candidatus Saccharimonadales bacterium]|nr:hypothetical protein [Candidatus Saccharimonadales bacterium]